MSIKSEPIKLECDWCGVQILRHKNHILETNFCCRLHSNRHYKLRKIKFMNPDNIFHKNGKPVQYT